MLQSQDARAEIPALVRLILDQGREQGSRPAITDAGEEWTFGHLVEGAEVMAATVEREVPAGEPLAILMAPSAPSVCALLAASLAGRAALLLPRDAGREEREEILSSAAVRSVLMPARARSQSDPAGSGESGAVIVRREGATVPVVPPALIQLTSGSLSLSRPAVRGWQGVAAEVDAIRAVLHLDGGDRVLCASSIAHSYGLIGGVLAPLVAGAQIFLTHAEADPRQVSSIRPTVLVGLASLYDRLASTADPGLEHARYALSAGAPLPPGLHQKVRERTGLSIRQDYGTTETGTISIDAGPEADPTTVGQPLPHMQLRITPSDTGEGAGSAGEVQVRSVSVALGYLAAGGISPCADRGGWYHTGDLGTQDSSGRLHLGRRLRDPVLIGGTSIRVDAIEAELSRLDGVREVAVVGTKHERQDGLLIAVVGDIEGASVERWCRRNLPAGGFPVRVTLCDALPRSPAGKVLHKYLS